MGATYRTISVLSVLFIVVGGCDSDDYKTATQHQLDQMEKTREQHKPAVHLVNMTDNAILQDMSITDFHFVGHSSELSGTGVARLDRMAPLLDCYGGVVRYDTSITDAALVQARLDHTQEYLALTGCSMNRVEIKTTLPGGEGMSAERAIEGDKRMREKKNQVPMGLSNGVGMSGGPSN